MTQTQCPIYHHPANLNPLRSAIWKTTSRGEVRRRNLVTSSLYRSNRPRRNIQTIFGIATMTSASCVMRAYQFNMFEIPDVTAMSPDNELGHVNIWDVCMFRSASEEHGCRIGGLNSFENGPISSHWPQRQHINCH